MSVEEDLDYHVTNVAFDSTDGFTSGASYEWKIIAKEGTISTSAISSFIFCEPIVPVIVETSAGKD